MRIIGIKLKDGEDSVIKNLKPGMWYPFGEYVEPTAENDWQWEKNTSDEKRLNQLYKESSDTQLSDTFTISVCSIVGKNGAGKSTLLDLMFRIINNLAYSLLEKKQEKDPEEENPQKGRTLSEANGFAAMLYFETDNNLGIVSYSYGDMSYEYRNVKRNLQVREEFDRPITNRRMHQVLNDFFYTICTNYSMHSFNEDDYDEKELLDKNTNQTTNGDWIRGILHKNDGYLTPVVIVPYRQEGGVIDISNEEDLAIQRLSVLAVLLWSQKKFLLDEYRPVHIEYMFDENAANEFSKKFDELQQEKLPLNVIEETGLPRFGAMLHEVWLDYLSKQRWYKKLDVMVQKSVLNYLCYKSLKICTTYRSYGVKAGIRGVSQEEMEKYNQPEGTLVSVVTKEMTEKLVKELTDDKVTTHITLKLHQCIAFMKRGYYKTDTQNHFDLEDTGDVINYHKVGIDEFIADNLAIDNKNVEKAKKRYDTYDEVFLMMPPSIFKWVVKFKRKNETKQLSLRGMSSGEKQMLQSASYLLYHIKNIENIRMDNYRNPYHHINIVMDEAELYFHPEYQRKLIANMIDMVAACHINASKIRSVNLIIATHSPFVLSDIPKSRILYLQNGEKIIREQQTFAANYHELLYNQFFIEYTMGEVGKKAIQEIIETYEMVCRNRQTDKYQNLLANYGEIREYYEFVVGMVADNYLKKSLEGMLEEIDYRIQHEKN